LIGEQFLELMLNVVGVGKHGVGLFLDRGGEIGILLGQRWLDCDRIWGEIEILAVDERIVGVGILEGEINV